MGLHSPTVTMSPISTSLKDKNEKISFEYVALNRVKIICRNKVIRLLYIFSFSAFLYYEDCRDCVNIMLDKSIIIVYIRLY